MADFWAISGSLDDVQRAISTALTTPGGPHIVHIPEGNFVFAASGSKNIKIVTPSVGISIIGEGIDKTVLQLPNDESNSQTTMFEIDGRSKGRIRSSGITFKGRGYSGSKTGDIALQFRYSKDFRVDHCSFYDMGSCGVSTFDHDALYGSGDPNLVSQGVVDHCYFYNIYKAGAVTEGTGFGYGVGVLRCYTAKYTPWEDIWNILGKYDKNVFVEDCYFTGCRHSVMSYGGGVYVFRHNIVDKQAQSVDGGNMMVDAHPARDGCFGSRCIEVYNNDLHDVYPQGNRRSYGVDIHGGGGVIFSNIIKDMVCAITIENADSTKDNYDPKGRLHNLWIWNNTLSGLWEELSVTAGVAAPAPVKDVDYFLNAPPAQNNYTPYIYPHPLTLEGGPEVTEINKSLTKQVSATVTASANVTANLKWILGDTEPTTPTGFARATELDIDLGVVGKFWAFMQVA